MFTVLQNHKSLQLLPQDQFSHIGKSRIFIFFFFYRGAGFCVNEQRESPSSSAPLSPKSYCVPPSVSHTPVSKLPAASAANRA